MPRNAFKEFASIFGARLVPECSGAFVQVPACGAPFQKPLQARPCALLSGHPWPTTFLERCPTSRNSNFGLQQIESLAIGNPDHCMGRDWVERLFKTVEGHGRPETSLQGRTRGRVLKSLSTQLCLAPNLCLGSGPHQRAPGTESN